ncbi:MAG: Ribosomal protein [Planctomycetota bacterium]|jgi:large subunit ribosomal protein L29
MEAKDIRKLTDEQLTAEVQGLKRRLYDLRVQTMVEKVNDHSQFGKIKRDVARLLTEQNARAAKKETAR